MAGFAYIKGGKMGPPSNLANLKRKKKERGRRVGLGRVGGGGKRKKSPRQKVPRITAFTLRGGGGGKGRGGSK